MSQSLTNPLPNKEGSTFEHIVELRARLITCVLVLIAMTGICYLFVDHILAFLIQPLASSMGQDGTQRLIYTDLTEAFFTNIKISFLTALFVTLPVILIQVWKFVAPGLYAKEKNALFPFFFATPALFICGALLVYYFIMPLAWSFFLGFQTSGAETALPIQLEAKISDYLNLIISLIFAFGLCFQLPVLLMLLARAGFITADTLATKRKYAMVGAFIVAAPLTPPDIVSQCLLAIPLIALFEISIFLIRHVSKPA
ncbi:MAG TPA: twin-arginine translocase subunit TatC [Alphaproteobacteria bacterium]